VSSTKIKIPFTVDKETSKKAVAEIENLVSKWTDAKGKLTDIKIDTKTSFDEKTGTNVEKITRAIVTYKNELGEVIKKTLEFGQIGVDAKNNPIEGFAEVAGQYSKAIDQATTKTDNFAKKQRETVANMQNTLKQITSNAFDKNTSKPIISDESISQLNTKIASVEIAMEALKNATAETFDEAKIKVKSEISELKSLEKELRNADAAMLKANAKKQPEADISSGVTIVKNNLDKLKADAQEFPQLTQKIKDLDTALASVGDETSLNKVNEQLKTVRSELGKIKAESSANNRGKKLGIGVSNLQTKITNLQKISPEISRFETEISGAKVSIESLLSDLGKVNTQGDLDTLSSKWKAFENAAKSAGIAITDVGNKADSLAAKASKISFNIDTGTYESKIANLEAQFKRLGLSEEEVAKKMSSVKDAYKSLTTNGIGQEELIKREQLFNTELTTTNNHLKTMKAEMSAFVSSTKQLNLTNKIEKWLVNNTRATKDARQELERYLSELNSGQITNTRFTEISNNLTKIDMEMRSLGKTGKTFSQTFSEGLKSLSYWVSPTLIAMKTISEIKESISSVRELDTALVDLKKTTTMSSSELENFYYNSNETAKQMGVTTKEIIEQASSWSRLGFSSNEAATKMAQISSKFASISPGMSTDKAQEGLVSIIKAWGLDVSEVEREVLDNINTLGNEFAESNLDIVEGMERSAAALATTGTSYQEAFALFTGAQEILQNAEVGGRALKSISLRLHGYDETTEQLSEGLTNIKGDLIDLTKTAEHSEGVSIFKEGSTTEFKSLVDYFGEINEIWDEMSQKQQNDFLETAFGKNQAQAGAAIIQNYEAVANAMKSMETAAGSSDREMSTIIDSLDYKLNKLSETGTGIAQNLFQRDDMGSVINTLTKLAEAIDFVTDKLGLLGTISVGAGLFAGLKNTGKRRISVRIS